MYILPVVVVSVALNVPKFFEITVKMEYDNATGLEVPTIENTDLRHKKHYILGYVMWTRLFSTAVIPVSLLVRFFSSFSTVCISDLDKLDLAMAFDFRFGPISDKDLGSISPNFVRQAKRCRRTAFGKKFAVQFH